MSTFPDQHPVDAANWDTLRPLRYQDEKYWNGESAWDLGPFDGDDIEGLVFEAHGYWTATTAAVNPHIFFQPNKTTLAAADMFTTYGSNPTTVAALGYSVGAVAPGIVIATSYPNSMALNGTKHVQAKCTFHTRKVVGMYRSCLAEYAHWDYGTGTWAMATMFGTWKDTTTPITSGRIFMSDFGGVNNHKFNGYMSVKSLR